MSFSEWEEWKLQDLVSHKKGFAFKSNELSTSGYPIVRVSNFTSDSIDMSGCLYTSITKSSKFLNCKIFENDIIIATVGSWPNNPNSIVGKVIKVPKIANGAFLNQNSVILRANNVINQKFLYYRLKTKDFSEHLVAGARGSANQASVALEDIFKFKFRLPNLTTQTKIASILSSLDDKIENNLKTNQTLEEIARTIFKEWFVNFNYPNADGNLKYSEFGEIPDSWEVGILRDVLDVKYGKDHKHLNIGNIPVYGSGGVMRFVDTAIYQKESILIPRKGTLSNLFYINKPFWSVDTMFFTQIKLRNGGKYLFHQIQSLNLASMNVGTAVPSLTTEILNNIKIVIPSDEVLEKFEVLTSSLFDKIFDNLEENNHLEQTRNSLLPKLMNGEIRI